MLGVICLIIVFSITTYACMKSRESNRLGLPFPPGPKALPLIGNLLDLPWNGKQTETYHRWQEQHGDLVHIELLGRHIVFINSHSVANDLFEKRSSNYSDRNELPMINDLMGWDWSFGHMPYGERWRQRRKLFHSRFHAPIASIYWPVQLQEARRFLCHLLYRPEAFIDHIRVNAARTIMKITYGIEVTDQKSRYVVVAEAAVAAMAEAARPGAYLVDFLPILKYVPAWMPGATFQRKARKWKSLVLEMRDAPFEEVQNSLACGVASTCFVTDLMTAPYSTEHPSHHLDVVRDCAGLAYAAGTEGIVASLSTFFLAMALHPDVQKRAHEELDSFLDFSRLPGFADRPFLPYVDAILKEVLRWNPAAPLGLPHMATRDDVYRGYFVPAGTIIIGNTRAILHNERVYPSPSKFTPERFLTIENTLDPAIPDPALVAFGYGRRICPGRFFAYSQLWIVIASVLTVFRVDPVLDEHGKPKGLDPYFTTGMISQPLPFQCSIKPRGDLAQSLIPDLPT